ncbi:MAG: alpha-ketoglutarate-dependent dioxygenase AlkB [Opitutae bacterium]|nr:alpha-ketoglutarate-dependent dioxygenase AlkB [Opitutae bacterium]
MDSFAEELFTESKVEYDLPDAEIEYFPKFFSRKNSLFFLPQLLDTIKWKQNTIKMYGKENPVPRLEAWYGDPEKSYAYSGIRMEPTPWTDELQEIKRSIEAKVAISFNSVLINYYRDGQDRVAWHSDDEKELGQNPVIGSVSFGAERIFKLRHKKYKTNNLKQSVMLGNGSFLLMKGATQHHWVHEIPRTAKLIGPRINLTFRVIK